MASTENNGNINSKLIVLSDDAQKHAITSLQRLLQFPTVSATAPETGAYVDCANYIVTELESLGFLSDIHFLPEAPDHSPVVIAHWKGSDESLPVVLLNSHYDVVPADFSEWSVPPFEGLRKDARIYGRGAQDMKSVCIQYIEALRRMSYDGYQPLRSIYLTFVPDEEIGGGGMAAFLESKLYREELPGIALALDEGLASNDEVYSVFYGERLPWWVNISAHGKLGHGSRFIENTAVEQLIDLANKALAFREGQRALLHENPHTENCAHAVAAAKNKSLGDVISLNITTLQAGVQVGNTFAYNCVPPIAQCSLDIRISPHVPPSDIADMLDIWCKECSKNDEYKVTWNYIPGQHGKNANDLQEHATTSTDVQVNPWYGVFSKAMESMNLPFQPQVCTFIRRSLEILTGGLFLGNLLTCSFSSSSSRFSQRQPTADFCEH
jgi:aminoacylase